MKNFWFCHNNLENSFFMNFMNSINGKNNQFL